MQVNSGIGGSSSRHSPPSQSAAFSFSCLCGMTLPMGVVQQHTVAIDGPAGAGKSTVARLVADALGYTLLDTGAMYRSAALVALRLGSSLDEGGRMAKELERLLDEGELTFEQKHAGVRVVFKGEDVSAEIRTPDIARAASELSQQPAVRDVLVKLQRMVGKDGGIVVEGRDIGTVVFPDARAKFFVTASVEVRAARRFQELVAKGETTTFDETLLEVLDRDKRDRTRAVAPLLQADDAHLVDTSEISAAAAAEQIVAFVRALS